MFPNNGTTEAGTMRTARQCTNLVANMNLAESKPTARRKLIVLYGWPVPYLAFYRADTTPGVGAILSLPPIVSTHYSIVALLVNLAGVIALLAFLEQILTAVRFRRLALRQLLYVVLCLCGMLGVFRAPRDLLLNSIVLPDDDTRNSFSHGLLHLERH